MSISGLSRNQRIYLEQLKSYEANGVRITFEDMEMSDEKWDKMFKLNDRVPKGSGAYYMPDFIEGHKGRLDEIRLDKIYNRI